MLITIKSIRELDFSRLMYVYSESNIKFGAERYPNLSLNQQLIQAEQDFYAYLKDFFRNDSSFCAVWTPDGKYMAALRVERYRDGFLITGLETAPNARRKGYAKKLLHAVLNMLRSLGSVKVYSHVNKDNIPSLSLHYAAGFIIISDLAAYIDGSVSYDACTLCFCTSERV